MMICATIWIYDDQPLIYVFVLKAKEEDFLVASISMFSRKFTKLVAFNYIGMILLKLLDCTTKTVTCCSLYVREHKDTA